MQRNDGDIAYSHAHKWNEGGWTQMTLDLFWHFNFGDTIRIRAHADQNRGNTYIWHSWNSSGSHSRVQVSYEAESAKDAAHCGCKNCATNYFGQRCEITPCQGKTRNNHCNGRGEPTPVGSTCQCHKCDGGYEGNRCQTACGAGRFSAHQASKCENCNAGRFNTLTAQGSCAPCGEDSFTAQKGPHTSCTACPAGRHTLRTGQPHPGVGQYSTGKASCETVDCKINGWNPYTTCTKSCGTGYQSRTRGFVQPVNNGQVCPHSAETRQCNKHSCAIPCVIFAWSSWSTCSTSCAAGFSSRTRKFRQPENGGKKCPHGAETKPCNHGPCPIHCAATAFSAWTTCTKSCGTGSQLRSRSIATHARHGGYVCPYLAERPSAARRAHTARRRARATRSPAR